MKRPDIRVRRNVEDIRLKEILIVLYIWKLRHLSRSFVSNTSRVQMIILVVWTIQ